MTSSANELNRARLCGFKLILGAVLLSTSFNPLIYSDEPVQRKSKRVDQCKVERSKLSKEEELRVILRTLRQAIDSYHDACQRGMVGPLDRKVDDECYPPTLKSLVTGVAPPNKAHSRIRFLRRIPIDPITGKAEWGVRSVQDEPGSFAWGGQNVFDVYSLSDGVGLDGLKYREW